MPYDPDQGLWAVKVSLLTNKELHPHKFYAAAKGDPSAGVWCCDPLSNETFDGNSVVRTSHMLRIAEQGAQGGSYVLHRVPTRPPLEPSYPCLQCFISRVTSSRRRRNALVGRPE